MHERIQLMNSSDTDLYRRIKRLCFRSLEELWNFAPLFII